MARETTKQEVLDPLYAWEMAEAEIETLAAEGYMFKRRKHMGPEPRGGRCVPYLASLDRSPDDVPYDPGTGWYQPTTRPFRLFEHNQRQGFILYVIAEVDTE